MVEATDTIPIIIADDDIPVANLIASYLCNFPEVEILKLTANGSETIKKVRELKPAVVFLDIEMPLIDGLTVAQQLINEMPNLLIVFVSSYPNYAADAFQFGAIDYIVKPVTQNAVNRSMGRIRKHLSLNKKAAELSSAECHRLILSNNRGAHFINPSEIIFIEKSERNCIIHSDSRTIETKETLNHLESKLNNQFFRCHKSFIINLEKVERIQPIAERIYEVHFYNYSKTVSMSGKKLDDFIEAVKEYF